MDQLEKNAKVAMFVVHFFSDIIRGFSGRSTTSPRESRLEILETTLNSHRMLKGVDVFVAGIDKSSLVPLDIDFSGLGIDPRLLVYETFAEVMPNTEQYDYLCVVEDDILVSPDIFINTFAFDGTHDVRDVFLPNRVEITKDIIKCIDLEVAPKMTTNCETKVFRGRRLNVYENPHSGFFLVDREKKKIISQEVDPKYRGRIIGNYMASAFAHYHKPFRLYRTSDGLDFHTVRHLDRFIDNRSLLARGLAALRVNARFPRKGSWKI